MKIEIRREGDDVRIILDSLDEASNSGHYFEKKLPLNQAGQIGEMLKQAAVVHNWNFKFIQEISQ